MAKIVKAVVNSEVVNSEVVVNEIKPVVKVWSNEITQELEAKRKAYKVEARNFEPDSDEEQELLALALDCDNQIKIEVAKMKAGAEKAELEAKRNERVELNKKQFYALFGGEVAFDNYQASLPELQRADFLAAMEAVETELLAKFANVKSSNGSVVRTASAAGEIDIQAAKNQAAGMTKGENNKALQLAGFARSTSWFAVDRIYPKAEKPVVA